MIICRKPAGILFVVLAAMLFSVGEKANAGGTLNVGIESDVGLLDPHVACGYLSKLVDYQIFEGLVEADLTNSDSPAHLKGQLAKNWEISDDGLKYTFYLRDGVKFQDGTPFNADAVKYNFDRFLNPKSEQYSQSAADFFNQIGYTKLIKNVEVVDEHTVVINLNKKNYQFLRMGMEDCPQMYFISPAAIKKYGDNELPLHPVGTGPFVFSKRENGVSITLKKNENYWGKKAKIDKVNFLVLEDPSTRDNALLSGEVQMIRKPNWDEIKSIKKEGFIVTQNNFAPNFTYVTLNMNSAAFKDARVRLAVNYAINREGIVKEILHGYGAPAYSMINPGNIAYDKNYKPYPYDPTKAKTLLSEAGYTNGKLTLEMDIPMVGDGELVEKWIQRDLAAVGIKVNLHRIEWLAYLNKWNTGMANDVDVNTQSWGQMNPQWTAMTYSCVMQPPNGWNVGWYCNPEADKIFEKASETKNDSEAAKLYDEAAHMIENKDAPNIPVYSDYNPVAISPRVIGFVNPAANWFDLSTVDIH